MVISENQEWMDTLRKLVAEITNDGKEMGKLKREQIELAMQLGEIGRDEDMNAVTNMPPFTLLVSGQKVNVLIGLVDKHNVDLIDFAESEG